MRLDARTRAAEVLRAWADALKLPFVGVLRDTQAYVRCIETGMTLFDLPAPQVQADLLQWASILRWLHPVLHPAAKVAEPARPPVLHAARRLPETVAGLVAAPPAAWAQEAAAPPEVDAPAASVLTDNRPRIPLDEPPVLTAVVPPAPLARPRLNDVPLRGALAKSPPTLGLRMRGLLDLGLILKRVQRAQRGA
jgi:hypothetical protein